MQFISHKLWEDFLGKTALITVITGQDGSYLAEFLLEKELCELAKTPTFAAAIKTYSGCVTKNNH